MESYDSEGKFIKRKNEGTTKMADDNGGKISLDTILKISQALVIPLFLAGLYLLMSINSMEKRFVAVEAQLGAMPRLDVLIAKIAVMEDRQNRNIAKVDSLEADFNRHRENSTYDQPSNKFRRE